jgi:hypothetical protein
MNFFNNFFLRVTTPTITMEKVERRLFAAKSWKALGEDSLLAIVWKETLPVTKHHVLSLFQASLEGVMLYQWRHSLERPQDRKSRRLRSIELSVQGATATKNESTRHAGRVELMGRSILFRLYCVNASERLDR